VGDVDDRYLRSGRESGRAPWWKPWLVAIGIVALVYLLVVAVGTVGSGFQWAVGGGKSGSKEKAAEIFAFASNPLSGLILGILATSLVQSSSTVTSVIVGLVAGGLNIQLAIPMIMGANIGTTVTNTIVSLGHIGRPQEFRRAFAAATVHDIFNLVAVVIFLSAEVAVRAVFDVGFLEWISEVIAAFLYGGGEFGFNIKNLNFIKPATKPLIHLLLDAKAGTGLLIGLPPIWGGVLMILIALGAIFTSILYLGRLLRANLTGRAERIFHSAVGKGPVRGIASGATITVLVQSSSTTTSLIVPMAGAGILSLRQIFPFTLGANVGTTVTALIAATAGAKTDILAAAALQIALVHLFFNISATFAIYGAPPLRNFCLSAAEWLANLTLRNRLLALAYMVGVYFVLPGALLLVLSLIGDGGKWAGDRESGDRGPAPAPAPAKEE